jgi:hypothetical protein
MDSDTISECDLHFKLLRRQYPVKLCFAMTINKSQAQTVKMTGIDLRTPVSTHGQLYMSLSRSTAGDQVKILFVTDVPELLNIVYPEVLDN